jgi:penicillin-insensitive murein endopeptidase
MLRLSRLIAAIAAAMICTPAFGQTPAKELFGHVNGPSAYAPASYGSYAKGCLAGAEQLAETGPTWQAMRLSRNRNWGHPQMIDFVERLSRKAAAQRGWQGLYVGDISQPRGGPMLTGHASHQLGLDADIWMLPATRLNLTRAERETLSSISIRTKDQRNVNSSWTKAHHNILRAAAEDPAVARIFVTGAAKLRMCKDTPRGDRAWLRKIRPWWGHHYHFHVRLNCPGGNAACQNQAPIPAGDGCKDAEWWVTDALAPPDPNAPKTKKKPKPPLTLAGLPQQCAQVLRK